MEGRTNVRSAGGLRNEVWRLSSGTDAVAGRHGSLRVGGATGLAVGCAATSPQVGFAVFVSATVAILTHGSGASPCRQADVRRGGVGQRPTSTLETDDGLGSDAKPDRQANRT
jgi:hypothetical protein